VRQSNLAAIQLYSKRGFTKTGVADGYYGDGENAITMDKVFVKESLVES
jgi:ribosomal protein S18 acetylase RimI-like enzyme